jgi:hypothetical protein
MTVPIPVNVFRFVTARFYCRTFKTCKGPGFVNYSLIYQSEPNLPNTCFIRSTACGVPKTNTIVIK